ncbi:hypothetical protein CYMTET_16193 [Cymbomonas tetramitiformis]|uniref:Tetratricopeptide repeat protein n=1 Tax=Cymbomonas tetramitiformis TaxID=36881 RepID=A0AAE0L8K4_9CHLO|nr:hypothetical protein CYMTET_16193 [Cymbomonas tetramitiformis]
MKLEERPPWVIPGLSPSLQFQKCGQYFFDRKNWDEAIEYFTKALVAGSDKMSVITNRSYSYFAQEKYDEALKDGQMSVDTDPSWLEGHLCMGLSLEKLQRPAEAVKCYEFGLTYDPEWKEGHIRVGLAYLKIEQPEAAKQAFLNGLEVDAACPRLRAGLAEANEVLASFIPPPGPATLESHFVVKPESPPKPEPANIRPPWVFIV